jgi:hypothetical protein
MVVRVKGHKPLTDYVWGGAWASAAQNQGIQHIRVAVLPDGRLSRDDAARYLGHQPKTLAAWHAQGKGPRSVKVGGRRFYFKEDLDAFIRLEIVNVDAASEEEPV